MSIPQPLRLPFESGRATEAPNADPPGRQGPVVRLCKDGTCLRLPVTVTVTRRLQRRHERRNKKTHIQRTHQHSEFGGTSAGLLPEMMLSPAELARSRPRPSTYVYIEYMNVQFESSILRRLSYSLGVSSGIYASSIV